MVDLRANPRWLGLSEPVSMNLSTSTHGGGFEFLLTGPLGFGQETARFEASRGDSLVTRITECLVRRT
jgi:hypothetical protein